jgi:serine/threonine protein kinase
MTPQTKSCQLEYEQMLDLFGFQFIASQFYLRVGTPPIQQGWILHLSVIINEMQPLCYALLPLLQKESIIFKMPKSPFIHHELNSGRMGPEHIGKIFTFYCAFDLQAADLARQINELTCGFHGPEILTDFRIGELLYTRYGNFTDHYTTDQFEEQNRVLLGLDGKELKDLYFQPPQVPPWTKFPFEQIDKQQYSEEPPRKSRLIEGRYLPVKYLKEDVKGDVVQCVYLKHRIAPTFCVVKFGRANLHTDEEGRDMVKLLAWQADLNKKLKGGVRVPAIIDYFETDQGAAMVSEYIDGKGLYYYCKGLIRGRAWFSLPNTERLTITLLLAQIAEQIEVLHDLGIVHRDITGQNFLVTEKSKITIIDLELAYSITENRPAPPFEGGTYGFTSPQQAGRLPPAKSDDVYSFGVMLMQILLNCHNPLLLFDSDLDNLMEKMNFIIRNEAIVELIVKCTSPLSEQRPSIRQCRAVFEEYAKETKSPLKPLSASNRYSKATILHIIKSATAYLTGEEMTAEGLWYSYSKNMYGLEAYPLGLKHIYTPIYRGIAGVLLTFLEIEKVAPGLAHKGDAGKFAWNHLFHKIDDNLADYPASLYFGSAGFALLISEGIKMQILASDHRQKTRIRTCLDRTCNEFHIIDGLAGKGLAIISCLDYLPLQDAQRMLHEITRQLVRSQQGNDSWTVQNSVGPAAVNYGFGYGMAGIIYYLLETGFRFKDSDAMSAAKKGMEYLISKMHKSRYFYDWPNGNKDKQHAGWWCNGGPGIALTFLKAFEYLRNKKYLQIAEMALRKHPVEYIEFNFSQCHGLTGLGEIYLEAFRVTGNPEWQKRADWIANLLCAFKMGSEKDGMFWLVERHEFPTADYMIGNGGILRFLLRYVYPDKLGFPLLPRPVNL